MADIEIAGFNQLSRFNLYKYFDIWLKIIVENFEIYLKIIT